jgi:hypothetical protein
MTIIKLNDLYFPQGNERGQYFEPYYKVIDEKGNTGHGDNPTNAIANIKVKS